MVKRRKFYMTARYISIVIAFITFLISFDSKHPTLANVCLYICATLVFVIMCLSFMIHIINARIHDELQAKQLNELNSNHK